MGMRLLPLAFGLVAGLAACTPAADQVDSGAANSPLAPESAGTAGTLDISSFTVDELFDQGGGGCGMTLWQQADTPPSEGFLFFNGLAQPSGDGFTLMKINGEFVRFQRTAAAGQEFYGQQTSQTFVSREDDIQLQVDTTLGEPGEIESVAVEGTLQLQRNGDALEIPVQGDAGC